MNWKVTAWENTKKPASIIIKAGADINAINHHGDTLLDHAVWDGNFKAVKFLVKHGANVETDTNCLKTAIKTPYYKTLSDQLQIIKYLLKEGSATNPPLDIPLLITAVNYPNNPEIVKLLLDNGTHVNNLIDPNSNNLRGRGETALKQN